MPIKMKTFRLPTVIYIFILGIFIAVIAITIKGARIVPDDDVLVILTVKDVWNTDQESQTLSDAIINLYVEMSRIEMSQSMVLSVDRTDNYSIFTVKKRE